MTPLNNNWEYWLHHTLKHNCNSEFIVKLKRKNDQVLFFSVNVCTPVKKIIFHLKSEGNDILLHDCAVNVTVGTVSGRFGFSILIDLVFGWNRSHVTSEDLDNELQSHGWLCLSALCLCFVFNRRKKVPQNHTRRGNYWVNRSLDTKSGASLYEKYCKKYIFVSSFTVKKI